MHSRRYLTVRMYVRAAFYLTLTLLGTAAIWLVFVAAAIFD